MIMIDPDPGHRNSRIEKNIFVQVGNVPLVFVNKASPEVTFSNNLWSGKIPPRPSARSNKDLFADPGFANPGGIKWEDYNLSEKSPARGIGIRYSAD